MGKKLGRNFFFMMLILAWTGTCQAEEVIDRIVAIVNDDIVTLSQMNKAAAPYRKNIMSSQESSQRKQELSAQLNSQMVGRMVEEKLVLQEAGKMGISVDESDVDNAVENFKKEHHLDQDELVKGLAAQGLTLKEYRENIKRQIIQSMVVSRAVRAKIVVTDEEINAYYDSHPEQFKSVKKYQLKNIIIRDKDDLATVQEMLKNKADFSELAKKYSISSNASAGGELGVFDISSFSEDIRKALDGVDKGQTSAPIDMGEAFQILYVEDIITSEQGGGKEQADKKIEEILFKEHGEAQYSKWIETLKKNAHIKLML